MANMVSLNKLRDDFTMLQTQMFVFVNRNIGAMFGVSKKNKKNGPQVTRQPSSLRYICAEESSISFSTIWGTLFCQVYGLRGDGGRVDLRRGG